MEENNLDAILSDVKQEGSDPFAALEETPADSAPEKEEVEEEEAEGVEPVAEDNVPFHQHPRWVEREKELKELRERDEAMAAELAEIRAAKTSQEDTEIPAWFSELYGDNVTAYQKYQEHEQSRTEEIKNQILTEQQTAAQKAQQETERWNKWVEDEISSLQAEGNTFDRNKLINTMLEYSPTDANNNLDFKKGMAIYKALEGKPDTAKAEARKELADTATVTTKGEPAKKDYMTPAELRNKSWASL